MCVPFDHRTGPISEHMSVSGSRMCPVGFLLPTYLTHAIAVIGGAFPFLAPSLSNSINLSLPRSLLIIAYFVRELRSIKLFSSIFSSLQTTMAHTLLLTITLMLLLKDVAICSPVVKQIDKRSLFYGATAGIQYANDFYGSFTPTIGAVPSPSPSPSPLSLTPAVFSHHVFHNAFNHQQQQQQQLQRNKGLIPITYGSSAGPSFFGGHNNHLTPVEDVEPYYYHGERILKQYLVSEKAHQHEILIDQHLGNPFQPPPILRYETRQLPFGGIVDVPIFDTNDLEQKLHPFKPSSLRKNHGPIALGSGSLGLITLPNGNVYLGSGSLGYVSEKQHVETLVKPTQRPFLIASPLHFGNNGN